MLRWMRQGRCKQLGVQVARSLGYGFEISWRCAQVIPQGDGYWCEQDSKSYDAMERRYVLRLKAADFTGETFLALFNDQARFSFDWTVHASVESHGYALHRNVNALPGLHAACVGHQ